MAPLTHGPNKIATDEQVEKRKHALRNASDDQIEKCEELLLKEGKSLTALVVGERGTGKSTLINTLFGKEIAEVDCGPSRKVKYYTGCVREVDITVVEVPELDIDEIRAHSQLLQRQCPNGVDVVYVCQKMYDRHRLSAIETLRRLSVVFGREIYKKAVVVLTFANDMPKRWGRKADKKFEKVWYDQAAVIREGLQKELHMSPEEADNILVLPAGYYDKDDPESSRQILDVTSDWINDLMLASANTSISAAPAFLEVMASSQSNNNGSSGRSGRGGRGGRRGCGFCCFCCFCGDEDSSGGGGGGLIGKIMLFIAACIKGMAKWVFDKICSLVKRVASAKFNALKGVAQGVEKVFMAIYEQSGSSALLGAAVGAAVGGAVAGMVVGGVTGIVIGSLVIVTLSVVLTHLFGIVAGLLIVGGTVGGFVVGAGLGALVGGIVGSIIPGAGTVAGAGVGAVVGGGTGAIAGGAAAGHIVLKKKKRI